MRAHGRWAGWVARACCAAALGGAVLVASAAEETFEQARFDALVAARGSFVLAFVTDWCTTCARQKFVVEDLMAKPRYQGLLLLVADFDKEVTLRRRMRVAVQSTFIAFKGGREAARSVGETSEAGLAALFDKAL